LPQTLKVRVVEREPIAQVQQYLLDAEGWVMLPLDAQQRSIPVQPASATPIITGANANEIRPGKQVESAQIRSALKLVTAFDHSPMAALVDLARVDVSSAASFASHHAATERSHVPSRWISTSNSIAGGSFMTRANSACARSRGSICRSRTMCPCMARFRGGSPDHEKIAASIPL
jgi:hypothetical protein